MKRVFIILLCAVVAIFADDGQQDFPEVEAPVGKIRGSIITSRLGRKIYSFRGIRYAEAPVCERRFQVAVPMLEWNETFIATEEGPSCPQMEDIRLQSEDCLRLNVYTTKLPSENATDSKRPVMVLLHPGGAYKYSGQSYVFGPQYLMDKDIVLVTINYRLSTLGLLSTGDAEAPGNLALKDQVTALRWIQRNIAAFAGDPNSVTLLGVEFGAVCAVLHMLSPMSKDLFHRVIAMSGSPVDLEPYPHNQKCVAKVQAISLNCSDMNTTEIVNCLKSRPVENITESTFYNPNCGCLEIMIREQWQGRPSIAWRPVVEPEIPDVPRFLEDQPINLLLQKKINSVPLIVGVTRDELGGLVVPVIENFANDSWSLAKTFNDHWNELAPLAFMYKETLDSNKVSEELRRFYLNDEPVGPDNIIGFAHLLTDTMSTFAVHRLAQLMAMYSSEPVYFYKFTYEGRYSLYSYKNGTAYGVSQMDDLFYLFNMSYHFQNIELSESEISLVESITSIWANFAQHGIPYLGNENTQSENDVKWEKYSPDEDNYLDINLHLSMKNGFFPARMQELEKIFPLSTIITNEH